MQRVSYKIVKTEDMWAVSRNGETDMTYVTQEAAFEASAASASADLRSGFDIVIQAAAPTDSEGASSANGGRPVAGDGYS